MDRQKKINELNLIFKILDYKFYKIQKQLMLLEILQYIQSYNKVVVSYSGGKDSSLLLLLLLEAVKKYEQAFEDKQIYVLNVDASTDFISYKNYVYKKLNDLNKYFKKNNYNNIKIEIRSPNQNHKFFSLMIGYGYPFLIFKKVCSSRMKQLPAKKFFSSIRSDKEDIIVLSGQRIEESSNRKRIIEKYKEKEIKRKLYIIDNKHQGYVHSFLLIKDLTTEEVFYFIRMLDKQDLIYTDLMQVYNRANRYGCMLCPKINEDRTAQALLQKGELYIKDLIEYKNYMMKIIKNNKNRIKKDGQLSKLTLISRAKLLIKLAIVQTKTNKTFITTKELKVIKQKWEEDFGKKGEELFKKIYNKYFV